MRVSRLYCWEAESPRFEYYFHTLNKFVKHRMKLLKQQIGFWNHPIAQPPPSAPIHPHATHKDMHTLKKKGFARVLDEMSYTYGISFQLMVTFRRGEKE